MCMAGIGEAVAGQFTSVFNGIAQYQFSRYQSDMAERNAKGAEANRASILASGELERSRAGIANGQLLSAQTASLGASGVALSSASPQAALTTNRISLAEKMTAEKYANDLKAWGFEVEAWTYYQQAKNLNSAAWYQLAAGFLPAGGGGAIAQGFSQGKAGVKPDTESSSMLGDASEMDVGGAWWEA